MKTRYWFVIEGNDGYRYEGSRESNLHIAEFAFSIMEAELPSLQKQTIESLRITRIEEEQPESLL